MSALCDIGSWIGSKGKVSEADYQIAIKEYNGGVEVKCGGRKQRKGSLVVWFNRCGTNVDKEKLLGGVWMDEIWKQVLCKFLIQWLYVIEFNLQQR